MRLPVGKIPVDILQHVVFRHLGAKRKEVLLGPKVGVDGAIIEVGNKALITSMDPITGALERIGWLAVNVNANDVATFGVRPTLFASCILLPEKAPKETIETICKQMNTAAKKLEIAIIGGHCETTPGIRHPIVVGNAMGIAEKNRYVTSSSAKPGDALILTKGAGIEGTAILAADKREQLEKQFSAAFLKKAANFYSYISVVEDAMRAFEAGGVTAMHDPTEGGVAGGIHELADASNVGVQVFETKIPIHRETLEICSFFKIDPLQLIGSGGLLIAAKKNCAENILAALKEHEIEASIIGELLKDKEKRVIVKKDGVKKPLVRPLSDHLWKALKQM
ncbi:MAG: AIR synthase family protein [Candidatus Bathyarchaeia archaeon]|nr:AIR synthase family protein [Candidatus Bathyarchaeota archaeon]